MTFPEEHKATYWNSVTFCYNMFISYICVYTVKQNNFCIFSFTVSYKSTTLLQRAENNCIAKNKFKRKTKSSSQ